MTRHSPWISTEDATWGGGLEPARPPSPGRYGLALAAAVTLLLAVGFGTVATTPAWSAGLNPLAAGPVVSPSHPVDFGGEDPAIAYGGESSLVVWRSRSVGGIAIKAVRVAADGTVLPPGPVTVSSGFSEFPDVAFDGTNYLVVYGRGDNVWARRVSGTGELLGSEVQLNMPRVDNFHFDPSVAWNGRHYLVAFEVGTPVMDAQIRGTTVSASGDVLQLDRDLSPSPYPEESVDVATDGDQFFVTWTGTSSTVSGREMWGTRVTTDGAGTPTVLDPDPIKISSSATLSRTGTVATASVAFDGTRYLAVWDDRRNDNNPFDDDYDIYANRVGTDGSVLSPTDILVAGGPVNQTLPKVAANGPFLVAWQTRSDDDEEVYAARVRGNGTVVDTEAILIDSPADTPDVARSTGDDWAVISAYRLSHRTVSPK